MLIRFTCENAFCFADEVSLSMIASSDKKHASHIRQGGKPGSPDILRAAGVYGANGHGKTKLVDAFYFLKRMACGGDEDDNPLETFSSFRLRGTSNDKPSRFELTFRAEGVEYEYGLIILNRKIQQEWLFETEKTKEALLFSRETNSASTSKQDSYIFSFGPKLKKSPSPSKKFDMPDYLDFLGSEVGDKRTFLGVALERQIERLSKATKWFCETLQIVKADANYGGLHIHAAEDDSFRSYLSSALKKSDTGITELRVKRTHLPLELIEKGPFGQDEQALEKVRSLEPSQTLSVSTNDGPCYAVQREGNNISLLEFVAVHKCDNGEVEFKLDDLSSGTRRLMDLFPILYSVRENDKVYVVDELDRKLHPLLAYNLIKDFLRGSNGQIVFTTHTTHLLDLDLLRRDEVWLVQKKKTGGSELYSLNDFKVRPDLDVRKGYLQGRFGGVPFLGDTQTLGWS